MLSHTKKLAQGLAEAGGKLGVKPPPDSRSLLITASPAESLRALLEPPPTHRNTQTRVAIRLAPGFSPYPCPPRPLGPLAGVDAHSAPGVFAPAPRFPQRRICVPATSPHPAAQCPQQPSLLYRKMLSISLPYVIFRLYFPLDESGQLGSEN